MALAGQRKVQGVAALLRGVPLLAWSLAAFGIGMGAAAASTGWQGLSWSNFALIVVGGVLFQGIVAHAVNELTDWRSGTDRHSDGRLSGGAKVLRRGYLTQRELVVSCWLGLVAAVAVTILLSSRVGAWVWWVFVVGGWSALSYSLPPLRLAYRPLVGEWLAAWPATWTCVYAGGLILGAPPSTRLISAASLHATMSVAWLMQHHLADIPADLGATPRKLTTVAWISERFGPHSCRLVVAAYFVVAICIAWSFWRGSWMTSLPVLCAICGALAALATDPRSLRSITVWQWVMISVTLVNAAILGAGFAFAIW